MLDILHYIFSSFWIFIGFLILVGFPLSIALNFLYKCWCKFLDYLEKIHDKDDI
jgi:hypothetical protein